MLHLIITEQCCYVLLILIMAVRCGRPNATTNKAFLDPFALTILTADDVRLLRCRCLSLLVDEERDVRFFGCGLLGILPLVTLGIT